MTTRSAKTRAKPASRVLRKTTVLDGYYASGDGDSLCFDRCPHLSIHGDRQKGGPGIAPEEGHRVYPDDMLPMNPYSGRWAKRAPYGRWRVIVEFEPRQRPAKDRKDMEETMRRQHAAVAAAEARRGEGIESPVGDAPAPPRDEVGGGWLEFNPPPAAARKRSKGGPCQRRR